MVVKPTDERRPWESFIHMRWVRAVLWTKTNGICWYCGEMTNPFQNFAVDHIIPVSTRPDLEDSWDNIVPCCKPCNSRKYTHTLEEFRERAALHAQSDGYTFEFERRGWCP